MAEDKKKDIIQALKTMDPKTRESIMSALEELVIASTSKPGFLEKLQSRKFLLSIAGIVAGFMSSAAGFNGNVIMVAVGGILIIASMMIYTLAEGHIDASRAKETIYTINTLSSFLIGSIDFDEALKQLQEGFHKTDGLPPAEETDNEESDE